MRQPPCALANPAVSTRRAAVAWTESLVRGRSADAQCIADVLPGVASVVGLDGDEAEDYPELLRQLVGGYQAGERTVLFGEEPKEELTPIDHVDLLQRGAFRKAAMSRPTRRGKHATRESWARRVAAGEPGAERDTPNHFPATLLADAPATGSSGDQPSDGSLGR
jgi:hypothetical protein